MRENKVNNKYAGLFVELRSSYRELVTEAKLPNSPVKKSGMSRDWCPKNALVKDFY